MRARLMARYGPDRGAEAEIGAEATIGRAADSTLQLTAPEVSQHHARIRWDGERGCYLLEDLGSLNGTRLDGEPVERPERLGRLHLVSFGGVSECFFVELEHGGEEPDAVEPAKPGSRTAVDGEAPTLPAALRRAAGGAEGTRVDQAPVALPSVLAGGGPRAEPAAAPPALVLEVDQPERRRYALVEGANLVGRSGRAAVRLRSRQLSRRHATLRVEGGRVWIRDEGSSNHTYVGGRQVEGEVELEPGAEIRFGQLVARLVAAGAEDDG